MRFLPAMVCWGYVAYLIATNPLLIAREGIEGCIGKTLLVVLLLAVYLTVEPVVVKKEKQPKAEKERRDKAEESIAQPNFDDESSKAQSIITDLKLAVKKGEEERISLEEALKNARNKLSETKKDITASERDQQINAEIVNLLGLMQDRGRLFDFLMDDITAYSDTQVGIAARVVHQGLTTLLKEYFEVVPVHSGKEGDLIKITSEQCQNGYSLIGRISDIAENTGNVVHCGWKTKKVTLPRVIAAEQSLVGKGIIATAQVEVK